jgi:hypothetical protein
VPEIAACKASRAEAKRPHLDAQMSTPQGRRQQDRDRQRQLPLEPFTRVIELDAWNLRERDAHWGQSASLRAAGQEPARWHRAYGGTCFRRNPRAQTAGGRPVILSRGTVMTRGGVDALKEPLRAEARRRGLGRANAVLLGADGAVWSWNLAGDRFPDARPRGDFDHVSQPRWAVAHPLHPDDEAAAGAWGEPLLSKRKEDGGCEVITGLEPLQGRRAGAAQERGQKEVACLQSHRERMDYGTAKKKGEPLGSAGRWNRPAGCIKRASNRRASSGARPERRR